MTLPQLSPTPITPAVARLDSLEPLDRQAHAALAREFQRARRIKARREILAERQQVDEPLLLVNGWAACVRNLEDGRRQIVNFLLPGDPIAWCDHPPMTMSSTIVAITDVDVCHAPDASVSPALRRAYARSRDLEYTYLLAQITRLGRLNALERIADLLLELLERLERGGMAADGCFVMPLTQEMMADALGLTAVHVNRTLQALRREGSMLSRGRELRLPDPEALRRSTGRRAN